MATSAYTAAPHPATSQISTTSVNANDPEAEAKLEEFFG
jgi:hypothetical protein